MTNSHKESILEALEDIQDPLEDLAAPPDEINDLFLKRAMTEAWFSDTLAWLLDPEANHGLGKTFLNKFVELIGKKRSGANGCKQERDYAQRESHVKEGEEGPGVQSTNLELGEATSFREFTLPKNEKGDLLEDNRKCDVVVIDREPPNQFMGIIENKAYCSNSNDQLSTYLKVIETRYDHMDIREYVYLTLDGQRPEENEHSNREHLRRWTSISWTHDLLPLLTKCQKDTGDTSRFTDLLIDFLEWIENVIELNKKQGYHEKTIKDFKKAVNRIIGKLFRGELNALAKEGEKNWSFEEKNPKKNKCTKLSHSSYSARKIYIEFNEKPSVTAQVRENSTGIFKKHLMPFGTSVDQLYDIIETTASKISKEYYLDESHDLYLDGEKDVSDKLKESRTSMRNSFPFSRTNATLFIFFS